MEYAKYWDLFLDKEEKHYQLENKAKNQKRKYLKKGYLHFDYRIWFPDFKEKFRKFILDTEKVCKKPFLPFLKIPLKTKRIRLDVELNKRIASHKIRPICYAAHYDALIYSFYSTYLSEKYEEFVLKNELDKHVLAYRSLELCNIDFAKEVFNHIKERGECVAIALDITGFFDNLDHEYLKKTWLEVINTNENQTLAKLPEEQFKTFKSLTQYAYIEKSDVLTTLSLTEKDIKKNPLARFCDIKDFREKIKGYKPDPLQINKLKKGIPQGSPISAVLANMYMIDYDIKINKLSKELNFIYRRYCDDIIVICDYSNFEEIQKSLFDEIAKIYLEIQPEKTEITHFQVAPNGELRGYKEHNNFDNQNYQNLQYLGFEFNGQNIFIRPSSLSRFYVRMKAGVKKTIKMAYGKNSKGEKLLKKKLLDKYTHLGSKNFVSYAYRAAQKMDSKTIKQQLANHSEILNKTIEEETKKRLAFLKKKGKVKSKLT